MSYIQGCAKEFISITVYWCELLKGILIVLCIFWIAARTILFSLKIIYKDMKSDNKLKSLFQLFSYNHYILRKMDCEDYLL